MGELETHSQQLWRKTVLAETQSAHPSEQRSAIQFKGLVEIIMLNRPEHYIHQDGLGKDPKHSGRRSIDWYPLMTTGRSMYLRNKSTQRHFLENVLENSNTNHRRLHNTQPCNNTNTRIMLTTMTPIFDSVESWEVSFFHLLSLIAQILVCYWRIQLR